MSDRDPRDDQLALFGGTGGPSGPPDPPSAPDLGEDGENRGDPGLGQTSERDAGRGQRALLERDAAARRTAQTVFDKPLLVEAGAGTGKTTTLTARILAWCLGPGWEAAEERVAAREAAARPLATPAAPDPDAVAADALSRVVAITFTEAAAAEMASRVGHALAALTGTDDPPPWLLPDVLPPASLRAERARALLGALDHLVVRTIHAFCRSLLAAHPLEAGLHPELQVDPDGLKVEEIVREVVEDRLRQAYGEEGDPDLLALAGAGVGPAELVEAVVSALVQENLRPEDLETSPFTPERIRALREGLRAAVRRFEEAAAGRLDGLARSRKTGETLEAIRQSAGAVDEVEAAGDTFETFSGLCSALGETWEDRLRNRLKEWFRGTFNKTEAGALEPGGGAGGTDAVAEAAGSLLGRVDELRRLEPELLERSRRAIAPLLTAARRQMRLRGLVTFHDLLAEARDLLVRRPDVAGRVRRRIDQLLVDELQDTDRLQVDVITAVALPAADGKGVSEAELPGLFLVGDPKQSIYGWRNADLRAYEALWERVEAAGGRKVTLAENFRSVPAILDEVTRAVKPVMVEQPGVQPRFEPLVPCAALADEPGFARRRWAPVEYWVSWMPEAEGDGDRGRPGLAATRSGDATLLEAEAVAKDLARLRREEGLAWGEAALLLRSFSDLDDYLESLRREGVPFAVTGDRQYYRRREVIDAAALVRSVIDPGDHLALLTVLRSPAVGVPDAALIPLWREGFPKAMTELIGPDRGALEDLENLVGSAVARMPSPSSVPGLDRVAGWERVLLATLDALARLRQSFARDPADRFVENLRRLLPLELVASARHLGAYRLANLDRFFRRLAEAMESSAGDVTAILRALRRGVSEALEEEEGRPPQAGGGAGEAEDAVQVMTIHKAKGLDFAHVYLAQLHKGAPPDRLPWVAAGEVREERPGGGTGRRVEYCLFGAPSPGYAAVEEERRRVEAAERVRTLYVAMTRAEERLVLAGAWPESPRPRAPEQAGSYLDLLGSRFPTELDVSDLWEGAADAGGRSDGHRVRWVFPALAPPEAREEAATPRPDRKTAPEPPTPETVAADSRRLRELRAEAAGRQRRPLGGPVSAESHRRLDLEEGVRGRAPHLHERRSDETAAAAGGVVERGPRSGSTGPGERDREDERGKREAAMAAGTAVHRVLEELDLGRLADDPAGALARERERLAEIVGSALPGGASEAHRAAAVELADTLVDRFALGPLLERLQTLATRPGKVLARELPVLLTPNGDGPEAPVAFLSGSVDLLYRCPDTGLPVVADYKTDRVEGDGEITERVRVYAPQAATYARAVQESLGLPERPRAELWFLWPGRVHVVTHE